MRFEPFGEGARGTRRRRKPRDAFADPLPEICGVNRNDLPVTHLEDAADHDVGDGSGVGAGHELIDDVGIGYEIDMAEVDKHQVSTGILVQPATPLKPKYFRATKRRKPDHLG